jgi:predicted PurR-regulated permease PerM
VIRFPVRTILTVLGLIVAVWAVLHVLVIARSVVVYVLIAIFLTLAINPLVAWLMRRGVR